MADIQDGKYAARPQQWAMGLTKNGDPQVEISFEIVSASHAGQHVTYFGSFKDGAVEYTMDALRNCGFEGIDLDALLTTNPKDVEVQLVIKNEEYQGKWSTKVKWVNKSGGLVSKPMETNDMKAFSARMRSVLAGLHPDQAKKRAAPGIDDDIGI